MTTSDQISLIPTEVKILHLPIKILSLLLKFTHWQVTACAFSYFELRQCRPKLDKLKRLLNELPYKGELHERSEDKDGKTRVNSTMKTSRQINTPPSLSLFLPPFFSLLLLHLFLFVSPLFLSLPLSLSIFLSLSLPLQYTYYDLLDRVQASEEELMTGLKQLQACLIDGNANSITLKFKI